VKLLAFGLVLLVAATAMLIFSDFNPATPFIAGIACTFVGIINLVSLLGGRSPASASDAEDAINLTRDIRSHH